MKFKEKLLLAAETNNSWLCVGLDPDPAKIPGEFGEGASAVARFCCEIIEATRDLVCAYKPNAAFFEALGPAGWDALIETVKATPANIPVILDFKRGDIGNTAQMYARSAFEIIGADAVTLSPYMGKDSLEPFLKYGDKGSFILCLTSNPSSVDLQKKIILLDEPPSGLNLTPQSKAETFAEFFSVSTSELYLHVAKLALEMNGDDNVGLVVGATSPAELEMVRKIVGDEIPILIPGVGSQGGDLEKSVDCGSNATGKLAIVNISRAIIYPVLDAGFKNGVRQSADTFRSRIANIIDKKTGHKS
jgi:orotidine-5'-phosphate decarboxylase